MISLLDISEVELKVVDASVDGNVEHAHAVWSVAMIEKQSMYRRWYRNVYTPSIPNASVLTGVAGVIDEATVSTDVAR